MSIIKMMKDPDKNYLFPESSVTYQERLKARHHIIKSFKAKVDQQRSVVEKIADAFTESFGSIPFLIINALLFIVWIVLNINIIPGIPAFDPFPFGLLTMAVSLEAIILSIFVLISQNRQSKIAELREEIDLQVNMIAEEEVTKIMKMVTLLLKKNGVDISSDEELKEMIQPINPEKIEHKIEQEIQKGENA